MAYIDRVARTERQYERFDDISDYAFRIEILIEQAGRVYPSHLQRLEEMVREAEAAKNAARDAIAGDF